MDIIKKLQLIVEKSNQIKTKTAVKNILHLYENGEISDVTVKNLVLESFNKLKGTDQEIDNFLGYIDLKFQMNDTGFSELITESKASELYKNDIDFALLIDESENLLASGLPESMVAKHFMPGIKKFAWNKVIKAPSQLCESKLEKFKSYRLVEQAIHNLETSKESEFYGEVIKKLDWAFHLPENHVRSYVKEVVERSGFESPMLQHLVEQLYLLDNEKQGMTTWAIDAEGRHKTYDRVAPVSIKENHTDMYISNKFLRLTESGFSRVLASQVDPEFLKICESFNRTISINEKLVINENISEFGLNLKDSSKPVFEVDGEEIGEDPEEALPQMRTMGASPATVSDMDVLSKGAESIMKIDACVTVMVGDTVVDIIQMNGNICICITSAMVDDVLTGDNVFTEAKEKYGIEIDEAKINEKEEKSEEELKIEAENQKMIDELQLELDEIESNMDKIEMLDEMLREDQEVQDMYKNLKEKQTEISEKISDLKMNNGEEDERSIGDHDSLVSNLATNINEIISKKEYEDELLSESVDSINSVKSGEVVKMNEEISVMPITQFEKNNDKILLTDVYLQFQKTGADDDEMSKLLNKAVEGSIYPVVDMVSINCCIDPSECVNISDGIRNKISEVLKIVAKGINVNEIEKEEVI